MLELLFQNQEQSDQKREIRDYTTLPTLGNIQSDLNLGGQ